MSGRIERRDLVRFGKNYAIIIGINQYLNIGAPLQTPVRDAEGVASVLRESQGFEPEDIHLLLNPTKAEIEALLDKLVPPATALDPTDEQPATVNDLSEQKSLLFYYAGHGLAGDLDGRGPAGYLLPKDASFANAVLSENETLIKMDDVFRKLEAIDCHHTLLILDCCFAGTFRRISTTRGTLGLGLRPMSKVRFDRYKQKKAWQVLTSAGPAEKAADLISDRGEVNSGLHSPFAEALMDALGGTATIDVKPPGKNLGDGVITAQELFIFLHNEVERRTRNHPFFKPQNPDLFPMGRHDGGQFIFCDPRHPRNQPDWDERRRANPYKGLQQMDVADRDYYFGRESDLAVLKFLLHLPLDIAKPAENALLEVQASTVGKAEAGPRLLIVSGPSGSGKSSLIKAGLLPELLENDYTVFQLRPGEKPWRLKLCHRYRWTFEQRSGSSGQTPLTFILPNDTGGFELKPVADRSMPERLELIWEAFAPLLTVCHPLELELLENTLRQKLEAVQHGEWTFQLEAEADWKVVYEAGSQGFKLLSSPTATVSELLEVEQLPFDPGKKHILYIDQYEELFTECTDEDRKGLQEELSRLIGEMARGPARLIISMRSDFEWQLEVSDFGRLFWLPNGDYASFFKLHRLTGLGLDDLRSALVNPALMLAYEFEKDEAGDLADEILEDLNYLPNSLPLLSFTMQEMVEETSGAERIFKREIYRNTIGGVSGALGRSIAKIYQHLGNGRENPVPTSRQRLMRQILLRMVQLSDGEYIRRRVMRRPDMDELRFSQNNEDVEAILDTLDRASLISRGGIVSTDEFGNEILVPYVELVHDALINSWTTGKQWINELGKDQLILQGQLWQAVLERKKIEALQANLTRLDDRKGETVENIAQSNRFQAKLSPFWDNNPKLFQIIESLMSLQTRSLLGIHSNQLKRALDKIAFELEGEDQALFEDMLNVWLIRGASPNLDTIVITGASLPLLEAIIKWGEHWLNRAEIEFILQSWEKRTQNILDLKRERDDALQAKREALAFAATANARQVYPNDNTIALNLAMAAHALSPTEETRAALHDIVSNSRSIFYRKFEADFTGWDLLAVSPRGTHFAVARDSGKVDLWDMAQQKGERFTEVGAAISIMQFSPDGRQLILVSGNEAGLWDLHGMRTKALTAHTDVIHQVAFAPNWPEESFILTGSKDGTAKLWDLKDNSHQDIGLPATEVLAVAISPDFEQGKGHLLMATTGENQEITITVWDTKNQKNQRFPAPNNKVSYLSFTPGGRLIVGLFAHEYLLWNLKGRQYAHSFKGHDWGADAVILAPNGRSLLTVSSHRTPRKITLWDERDEEVSSFVLPFETLPKVAYSPDGAYILTISGEKVCQLWDLDWNVEQSFFEHNNSVRAMCFSEDGRQILTGTYDRGKLWNLQGEVLSHFYEGYRHDVRGVYFLASQAYLITKLRSGQNTHYVCLWTLPPDPEKKPSLQFQVANPESFTLAKVSPDGQYILTTSIYESARLKLLSVRGKTVRSFEGLDVYVEAVACCPNWPEEQVILFGTEDEKIRLWDLKDDQVTILEGHQGTVTAVAFSPNWPEERLILSGSADKTVRMWDMQSKRELQRFIGHTEGIFDVTFSPDGAHILTGSHDGTAKLWDRQGKLWQSFEGSEGRVLVAFSPNWPSEPYILTGQYSGAHLWRVFFRDWEEGQVWPRLYQLSAAEKERYKIDWDYAMPLDNAVSIAHSIAHLKFDLGSGQTIEIPVTGAAKARQALARDWETLNWELEEQSVRSDIAVKVLEHGEISIWDEIAGKPFIEVPVNPEKPGQRAEIVRQNLQKIVWWKDLIELDNPDSALSEVFDFELDIQEIKSSHAEEVHLSSKMKEPINITERQRTVAVNFRLHLQQKVSDLWVYTFDLSENCAITCRNDGKMGMHLDHGESGTSILLRSTPYRWELPPGEQTSTRWFKVLLVSGEELDIQLFEQPGLLTEQDPDAAGRSLVEEPDNWCAKTIKLTLSRE